MITDALNNRNRVTKNVLASSSSLAIQTDDKHYRATIALSWVAILSTCMLVFQIYSLYAQIISGRQELQQRLQSSRQQDEQENDILTLNASLSMSMEEVHKKIEINCAQTYNLAVRAHRLYQDMHDTLSVDLYTLLPITSELYAGSCINDSNGRPLGTIQLAPEIQMLSIASIHAMPIHKAQQLSTHIRTASVIPNMHIHIDAGLLTEHQQLILLLRMLTTYHAMGGTIQYCDHLSMKCVLPT